MFKNCKNFAEAKALYKKLVRENHPDMGGSTEKMQEINRAWDNFCKCPHFEDSAENDSVKADGTKYAQIINELLKYPVTVDLVGSWLWVTGDTFTIKYLLKSYGFKWASKKRAWYLGDTATRSRGKKSLDEIKDIYGCTSYKGRQQARIA